MNNNRPKVSVLIPVFNGARFLAECLESVLAQDFTDMEILVGDDHSTDESCALLEKFAARDPRIRWWRNPRNLGLAANFNCCLRAAQGEYVKFVLQDDVLLGPEAIRLLVAELDAHPAVALVASASYLLDAQSRKTEHRNYFAAGITAGHQVILRCLEQPGNLIGEPSLVMFRRDQALRGFDENYRQLVDWEMWIHLLAQGDFAYVAKPLAAFRIHAAQQTQLNKEQLVEGEESLRLLEHCCRQPWFSKILTRKILFVQLYCLRRHPVVTSGALYREMKHTLGFGWYCVYLLQRKLLKPFTKLGLWLARVPFRLGLHETP